MTVSLKKLLVQADALRFKLLAIVGKDEKKKEKIVVALKNDGWTVVDVESELLELRKELEASGSDVEIEIQPKIKEWFNSKPQKIILTNASILYHNLFLKMSPIGAFKYNSRNKNCVLFLEDEKKLGSRIYYGEIGREDYYDQEISDIILVNIEDISDDLDLAGKDEDEKEIPIENTIRKFFNFHEIKDVVDIDSDLIGEERRKNLVSNYIISESLETQIADFFEDLKKPTHKARTIIGNYGSGKSHLVGFLASLVEEPRLAEYVSNEKVKQRAKQLQRKFYIVQFELGAAKVPLKRWFYGKVRKQLKEKYDIDIPVFNEQEDFDDKENIIKIVEKVKAKDPVGGLLVMVDEISDFLMTKQKEDMKADLQFLRVVGQVCNDQDFMFVGSMQEDVFSSPKFKNIAKEVGRVGERFQNIIIHKEDVKKVISQRIVPKTEGQRHALGKEFTPFAEKIESISRYLDDYIDLFPMTPFIIELFSDLPYFEKRGVIQFSISKTKRSLNKPFPYFITFDKIYDLLENDPNKRNLEEIHEITKAMDILKQKINLLEEKHQEGALKIVKGLAIYSLWNKREGGATSQELADNLMLLPQKKIFKASDHISLIVSKIRGVTDGEYIKVQKDKNTGIEYFRFDTKAGIDPEQKIQQVASDISNDEQEHELFEQLKDVLELDPYNGSPDIFEDECLWQSVKSFRLGHIVFAKRGYQFKDSLPGDYVIVFVSPFVQNFKESFSRNQLTIKLHLQGIENVELLKEIVAIKQLINTNFQKYIMQKKLEKRINGDNMVNPPQTGFRYRLAKMLLNYAECDLNGKPVHIKKIIGRERVSVPETVEELKTALFDKNFNNQYPLHPIYPLQLSSRNILNSLHPAIEDLTKGNFTNLNRKTVQLLQSLNMLDTLGYPSLSQSKIAREIIKILKKKAQKVTDIEKEIVQPLKASDYGLEKEMTHFILVAMTVLGKIYLQAKGGDRIDINNIREKIKTLAAFETIAYARLQEDYSYDFAARLLNALGLNGNKITIEKERLSAFREYKEKIKKILEELQGLEQTIEQLSQKPQIFLDMDALRKAFAGIKEIEWKKLDITNHAQFGKIEEYFSERLDKITIALANMANLIQALQEYRSQIHEAILYMDAALDLLVKHPILVTDEQKLKVLQDFRDDAKTICEDFSRFIDRSQRNPIRGKIEQFKKSYIYDFYLPAHEKYVGKKVDWEILDTIREQDLFKRLTLLTQLTCISNARFEQMVLSWNDLKQYKCTNPNLEENLKNSTLCQKCFFPERGKKYSTIPETLSRIEDELQSLYKAYEKTVLTEMRSYRDNIRFLDHEDEKKLVNDILKNQKLPYPLTPQTVKTINKLFKEIEVIEVEKDKFIDTIFPNQEMITIKELRKNFLGWIENLKRDREEGSLRIKLSESKEKTQPEEAKK